MHRLVLVDRAGTLLRVGERLAIVELRPDRLAVIVCTTEGVEAARSDLDAILEHVREAHLDLVVIGGHEPARELVRSAQPRFMMRRIVRAYHLDDAGELWTGRSTRRSSAVAGALQAVADAPGSPASLEDLAKHVFVPRPEERLAAREHQAFIDRFRARRPIATWVLASGLAAVFGLEALWGGTELVPTLVRMGANTRASLAGEPWRLLSSAFLHAGPWHFVVNVLVLIAFGGFVERILGGRRFVLLVAAAALGGGLASAAFLDDRISVGASGAIWGLFGAAAALAWRPEGVLPQRLLERMRRIAIANLVINLTVSFLPQVDMMAHLGGGIVGAGLVGSGLLLRGLPPLHTSAPQTDCAEHRAWGWLAATSAILLCGCLAVAWVTQRPWALVAEPQWSRVVLDTDVSVDLPDALASPRAQAGRPGGTLWIMGDLGRDPLQVVIEITPAVDIDETELDAAVGAMRRRAFAAPPAAKPIGSRSHPDVPGVAWEERFAYPSAARSAYRLIRLEGAEVLVEVTWWQDAPSPWPDDAVERVLDSIR